jgi:hypothetical protein
MSENYSMQAEPEVKTELSEEDKDLLLKGIRPEWMNIETFKKVRKDIQTALKQYRKGKFVYISSKLVEKDDQTKLITPITKSSHIVRLTSGPYVKSKETDNGIVSDEVEVINNENME